jgi:hypothetical protein
LNSNEKSKDYYKQDYNFKHQKKKKSYLSVRDVSILSGHAAYHYKK